MPKHIRRDGAWLCKKDLPKPKPWHKKAEHISFKEAHSADLNASFVYKNKEHRYFCGDCTKRYYEIVNNLADPIVIEH